MKLLVSFTVDVDWCDEDLGIPKIGDPLRDKIADSVGEALCDALQRQRDNGFNHDMENEISIMVDSYITVKWENE